MMQEGVMHLGESRIEELSATMLTMTVMRLV